MSGGFNAWEEFKEIAAQTLGQPQPAEVAKIPEFCQVRPQEKFVKQQETTSLNIDRCCQAPDFFRAGFFPEEVQLVINLPCSPEKAELCRKKWAMVEKMHIYIKQSDAAQAGDVAMLKHLGKAVLEQDGKPRLIDPGIGDIVFNDDD